MRKSLIVQRLPHRDVCIVILVMSLRMQRKAVFRVDLNTRWGRGSPGLPSPRGCVGTAVHETGVLAPGCWKAAAHLSAPTSSLFRSDCPFISVASVCTSYFLRVSSFRGT